MNYLEKYLINSSKFKIKNNDNTETKSGLKSTTKKHNTKNINCWHFEKKKLPVSVANRHLSRSISPYAHWKTLKILHMEIVKKRCSFQYHFIFQTFFSLDSNFVVSKPHSVRKS
jgi:hypothetical protein